MKAVPAGQSYIASFAVSWLTPNGTSPTASAPLSMTIVDPSIRAGDTIYLLTPHGLKAVGTATRDGAVTVKFTTDPAFVVAAVPKVAHLKPPYASLRQSGPSCHYRLRPGRRLHRLGPAHR